MTTTIISQIILRQGQQLELPGIPTSGNPNLPTTGLAVGEPAFTVDTGRVFIGGDNTVGGIWQNRATFPYTNIEILTENSGNFLSSFVDSKIKSLETSFYTTSPFAQCSTSNTSDWRDVQIPLAEGNVISYKINDGTDIGNVEIFYFVYDTSTTPYTPIKNGKINILYGNGVLEPMLNEECIVYGRSDLTIQTGSLDPNTVYGSVQFRANLETDFTGTNLILQYRNILTGTTPVMSFRTERAIFNSVAMNSPYIIINTIGNQSLGQSFTIMGTMVNYQTPPTLYYLDSVVGSTFTALPGSSVVTYNTFRFTHPAITTAGSTTVTLKDLSGISVVSNAFTVS